MDVGIVRTKTVKVMENGYDLTNVFIIHIESLPRE
jgi:hypothetical protein